MTAADVKVDPEFAAEIAPLTDAELAELRASLIAAGRAIDPLRVWQGLLLDGHHRLAICKELGLPYETVEIDLLDRAAALEWIDKHQRGRRNETVDEAVVRAVLRGRGYPGQAHKVRMAREMLAAESSRLAEVRGREKTLQQAYNDYKRDTGRAKHHTRTTTYESAQRAAMRLGSSRRRELAEWILGSCHDA